MYELKTKVNDGSVSNFLNMIDNLQKREDAFRLLDIFTEVTGLEAKMWGDSMVGFGSYHYKYPSGHEGEFFLTGFSPRKTSLTLYLDLWDPYTEDLLSQLGKHTKGKSCLYIKKLDDVDIEILKKLIAGSLKSEKIYV